MRIKSISTGSIEPIAKFEVDGLSDLVVIAGRNGVGKSRLLNALIQKFRNMNLADVQYEIETTCPEERGNVPAVMISDTESSFVFNTRNSGDTKMLQGIIQQNRSRRNYKSSILFYDSDRKIDKVKPLPFQFEFADPYSESMGWDFGFNGMGHRWSDTQHSIFKKIHRQTTSLAGQARNLKRKGHETMNLNFEEPLEPFQEIFHKLLGPKRLVRADLQSQKLIVSYNDNEFPVDSLSSGEREVLTIAFDFLLRNPSDCIILFDEPEMHLHPELLNRLINTLKSIGERNQFIYVSHSPEIIASSLRDTVIFLTPRKQDGSNQALRLDETPEVSDALNELGQSVGVISLGKKVVLIEGTESSLDRQTYGEIANELFPELVLLPAGGRDRIDRFADIQNNILQKSLWGMKFFMLTDRDTSISETDVGKNLRRLRRYHLENYFLDPEYIAKIFDDLEAESSWLRDPAKIAEVLKGLAKETLPYSVALNVAKDLRLGVGSLGIKPSVDPTASQEEIRAYFVEACASEVERLNAELDGGRVAEVVASHHQRLSEALSDGKWVSEFPGKAIFSKFCKKSGLSHGRFRRRYIAKSMEAPDDGPLAEIVEIFRTFAKA